MTTQTNPDLENALEELRQAPTVKPLTQSTTFKGNVGSAGIVAILIGLLSAPGAAEILASLDPRLTLFLPLLINAWNTYQRTKTTSGVAITAKKAEQINTHVEREIKTQVRIAAETGVDTSVAFGGVEGTSPLPVEGKDIKELTYEPIEERKAAVHKAPTEPLKEPEKQVSKKEAAQQKAKRGRPKGSKNGKKT